MTVNILCFLSQSAAVLSDDIISSLVLRYSQIFLISVRMVLIEIFIDITLTVCVIMLYRIIPERNSMMNFTVKHKIIILVSFLIILLSFGLSIANYLSGFEHTRNQLKENSLPLSTDNIYADIQKIIIEPSLISSMMANDTFVLNWFKEENKSSDKIVEYLAAIKEKYGFSDDFLASSVTGKYYTSEGFLEVLSPSKKDNDWYYRFCIQDKDHEVNIDNNELLDNNLLLFFNYKIHNESRELLGVVGVVFKTEYISKMFHKFREYYKLNVLLIDEKGSIKLSEQGITGANRNAERSKVAGMLPMVLEKKSNVFDYEENSREYLVKSKYIEELGLYLVVYVELEEFTASLQNRLIANIAISMLLSSLIILIILRTVMSYTRQLNLLAHHDVLTGLSNRRTFNHSFKMIWEQYQRSKRDTCLIFFDIDKFKDINDTLGHPLGDKVLVRVAELLRQQIRNTDYISRWGGEEFSVLLIDSRLEGAMMVADKLRNLIQTDVILNDLVKGSVTVSLGVTEFHVGDSVSDIMVRADVALYRAKQSGRNCVKSVVLGELESGVKDEINE